LIKNVLTVLIMLILSKITIIIVGRAEEDKRGSSWKYCIKTTS